MIRSKNIFFAISALIFAAASAAHAQESDYDSRRQSAVATNDPTAVTAEMADELRARMVAAGTVSVAALVVNDDADDGIAVLRKPDGMVAVRAGSLFTTAVNGANVESKVVGVTARGVEIETPSRARNTLVPCGSARARNDLTRRREDAKMGAAHETLAIVECNGLEIDALLRMLADQTGENYSASASAARETVTLLLRDVPAAVAVEEACRISGLWFRKDPATGVTRITTMREYEENISAFQGDETEVFTLLYPNVFEVANVLQGIWPERVSVMLGGDSGNEDAREMSGRFERFNMISSGSDSGLLQSGSGTSTGGGYNSYGGAYSSYGGYGGGGRITRPDAYGNPDTARRRDAFNGLSYDDAKAINRLASGGATNASEIARYSVRPADIFVTASPRNNILVVRTADSKALEEIRQLVRRLDVPTPMVLLEVRVLQLNLDKDFTSSFEFQKTGARNVNGNRYDGAISFPGANPLAAAADLSSLSFFAVSDDIAIRMQLLEKNGRIKTLATPTLLTANNEVSRLFIGEERPMIRNVTGQIVVNDNSIVTSPTTEIEFRPVGNMLLITPSINADRTVTLRLLQENSKIIPNGATIPVFGASGAGSSNNNGALATYPVDVISSRSISGTFIAKDQLTVAAGGLIEEEERIIESKVPVLGSIPLIGFFFRSKEVVKTRSELVVLIKPHVISTPQEGETISRRVIEGLSAHPARDGRPSMGVYKDVPANTNAVDKADSGNAAVDSITESINAIFLNR